MILAKEEPLVSENIVDPEQIDWGSNFKHLVGYTIDFAARRAWYGDCHQVFTDGIGPEDVAAEIILAHFDGRRPWDPAQGPLLPWLKLGISWAMLNLLKSSAAHSIDEIDDDIPNDQAPESLVLGQIEAEERWDKVLEAASGVPALEDLVLAMMEAVELGEKPKPQYVAVSLGVSREDIYDRLRKLRRHLTEIVRTR